MVDVIVLELGSDMVCVYVQFGFGRQIGVRNIVVLIAGNEFKLVWCASSKMLSFMVARISYSEAKRRCCHWWIAVAMIEEKESSSVAGSVTVETGGDWLWNVVRRLTRDWLSHRIVHSGSVETFQ